MQRPRQLVWGKAQAGWGAPQITGSRGCAHGRHWGSMQSRASPATVLKGGQGGNDVRT